MAGSEPTLEKELHALVGTGRNGRIAARYYGFDGRGGETLQSVGDAFGLTRERVRQIVSRTSKKLAAGQLLLPILDRTIRFVGDHMPAAASLIEIEVRAEGLSSSLFHLEGVINAGELLGAHLPFAITRVGGARIVHAKNVESVGQMVRVARRVIKHGGMATLSSVVAMLRNSGFDGCDRNLVASLVGSKGGFRWLNRSAGWVGLSGSPANRVLNRIRKILSVKNPICVSRLRAGIAREHRMRGFSPPRGVLLEFCRQAPGLQVHGDMIKAKPRINGDQVLSRIERDIVRILAEQGGALTWSEFKTLLETGVNYETLYHNLLQSPIVSKHGRGLFGLIGQEGSSEGRVH